MNYKILFHPEAEKEFFQLDNRVRILVKVIAIGKRDSFDVYKTASERLG